MHTLNWLAFKSTDDHWEGNLVLSKEPFLYVYKNIYTYAVARLIHILPVPVCAIPIRLLPPSNIGHAWHCIGDGFSNFCFCISFRISGKQWKACWNVQTGLGIVPDSEWNMCDTEILYMFLKAKWKEISVSLEKQKQIILKYE